MSAAARETAVENSWEKTARLYQEIYTEILDAKRIRG
jgi:hypothetical protein